MIEEKTQEMIEKEINIQHEHHYFLSIPNLYMTSYNKQNPDEKGRFDSNKKYPVLFINPSLIGKIVTGDTVETDYEIVAFVLDEAGELIPINMFLCTMEVITNNAAC